MSTSSKQKASSANSGFSVSKRRGVGVGDRGFPIGCRCGEYLVIRTSGTTKNPGQLFHCCPQGSEADANHLFKWTDEAMVEEIDVMKEVLRSTEKEIEHMKDTFRGYGNKLEAMKTDVVVYAKEVSEMEGEIRPIRTYAMRLKEPARLGLFLR
ncbi:uncharacterized protein At4g04775-like [Eutrema salsugineum]|uniref:uncharacterized protein At4g04775-like n=1 Tax=Eutrema salsugineum TaxID=72664 RepID=UPI000CED4E41|nr:uncharacterized protein At4g04775-like [Eutrema salsugineum]